MRARTNPQAALETACFVVFGALLLHLVADGKYRNYVTPRMAPYLCLMAAVLLVWAGFRFRQIFRPQYRNRASHCLVLVVPMLLLPLGEISLPSAAALDGTSDAYGTALVQATASRKTGITSPNASSGQTGTSTPSSGSDKADQNRLSLSKDGSIQVSDSQFYAWLSEIYSNMDQYDGKTITIKGFVYRDPETMGQNGFVPVRMLISCCAADLVPCGILCEYGKTSDLKSGAWITVAGTIHVKEELGERQPVVTVTQIAPANPPAEEYVYP